MDLLAPKAKALSWMAAAVVFSVVAGAAQGAAPTYVDYNGALKGKTFADVSARCEEVIGYAHLFILWERSPSHNNKLFLEQLEKTDGIDIMEVHEMHFSKGADAFADCHLNFYTNNNCGTVPGYSHVFMSKDYLSRTKGVGPFKVVLYKFNCQDTQSQGMLNVWRGIYSDYLRTLKAVLRKNYSTISKFTIHGTMNRLESIVDIESLFGPGKYDELTASAKQGKRWDGQVTVHREVVCPTRRTRPCETAYEKGYDLEL
mmetsp:Transcript_25365/g.70958  ORF Transcript_25365/g.70958 Transcript_25365/m.70958 type:complete len:258 (-) Transcript_25365:273-1046(-)